MERYPNPRLVGRRPELYGKAPWNGADRGSSRESRTSFPIHTSLVAIQRFSIAEPERADRKRKRLKPRAKPLFRTQTRVHARASCAVISVVSVPLVNGCALYALELLAEGLPRTRTSPYDFVEILKSAY